MAAQAAANSVGAASPAGVAKQFNGRSAPAPSASVAQPLGRSGCGRRGTTVPAGLVAAAAPAPGPRAVPRRRHPVPSCLPQGLLPGAPPAAAVSARPPGPLAATPLPAGDAEGCDGAASDSGHGAAAWAGCSSLSFVRHSAAVVELASLLAGRRVALLWDLDNVDFFAPACCAPLQLERIKALIRAAGGQLVLCRAFANYDTARRLRDVLPLLESCGLLTVERVAVRNDAADERLVAAAMGFALGARSGSGGSWGGGVGRQVGGGGAAAAELTAEPGGEASLAVLCVSQDTDFAAPLRHLSERGIVTVAISTHEPRRRTHAVMEPSSYFRRLPLPQSCWAALRWEPWPSPVTAAEARWLGGLLDSVEGKADCGGGVATLSGGSSSSSSSSTKDDDNSSGDSKGAVWASGEEGDGRAAAVGTPRGLRAFAREGCECPGSITRLWLNPQFCGR